MMSSHLRTIVVGTAVVAALLAGGRRAGAQQAGLMVGASAPDAVVETLDGQTVHLSDITEGKPAVLEFWATWCPLCRELEPAMATARAEHGMDVVFVSVGVRDNQTPEAQAAYMRAHKLGGQFVFDRNGDAVKAFQVTHTSFIVIVNADGKVVYTGVGGDQNVEAAIGHLKGGM